MATGMAFSAGSFIAHQEVRAMIVGGDGGQEGNHQGQPAQQQ